MLAKRNLVAGITSAEVERLEPCEGKLSRTVLRAA
jgi:hypothetical protein